MQSTGGYYFLRWERDKIEKLKTTSTTSTTSTNPTNAHEEILQKDEKVEVVDMMRENNVVNLEDEEVEVLG